MQVPRIVAAALLAAGVTAGVAAGLAAPAQALPPGTLFGYYDTLADCRSEGDSGVQRGEWVSFACTTQWANGYWALYTVPPTYPTPPVRQHR